MTTFRSNKPSAHDQRVAYLAGWRASQRSTTADLEAAEARYMAKHDLGTVDDFTAGWTDHASDREKWTSRPLFHPRFAGSQLAYDAPDEALYLWTEGFRPFAAVDVRQGDTVAYRATDVFGLSTTGRTLYAEVYDVEIERDDVIAGLPMNVIVSHGGGDTEADPEDEVWLRRPTPEEVGR